MAVDRDKVTRNALRFTQKGQFQKAIAEYQKLLSMDPRDIRTRLKLLDLYGRAGKKKEAIQECLEVAESYSDQGFFLKAIAVYKQALRIDPENPFLYRNMGEMYVKQGLVAEALGSYKRGVEVLRRQDKGAEAEQLLVRMEEMAPENAAIKIHLAELYLEDGRLDTFEGILAKLVLQLRGEGRTRKLLQAVESFYEKSNQHPSVLKRLAELYVELGEEEQALRVVSEGLARQPADRDLRLLALRAYLLTGQLVDARRIALALCEEDPDDLHILEQLASIAQARADQTELAQVYKSMAKVYGRRGLAQKEEFYFSKVAEITPDDAEARLALGDMVVDVAVAEEFTEEPGGEPGEWEGSGLSEEIGDAAVHDGLLEAELYLKYGMEDKAAEKLAELTNLVPDDIQIRSKLRDLCQRKGDREGWIREQLHIAELFLREKRENEALRAYQAIVEVDPENADACKGIQYLKPGVSVSQQTRREIDVDGSTVEFVQGDEERVVRVREQEESSSEAQDDALREALAEADFYEAQELNDEAVRILQRLNERYPGSPHVVSRLERLGAGVVDGVTEAEAAHFVDDGFVDLQAEILDEAGISLGGDFAGFQDFEVSELDDIVREFKSGIADRLGAEDYDTHYNLGVAYREMGLYQDSIEEFQIAARSQEKAREAYISMGQVYRDMEQWNDAQAALRMALGVPGNTAEDRVAILFEMGFIAEKQEDWETALVSFQKAADIDPNHRDVQKRIQRARARSAG